MPPTVNTLNSLNRPVGRGGEGVIETPLGVHFKNSIGFKLGMVFKNKLSPMDRNLIAPN